VLFAPDLFGRMTRRWHRVFFPMRYGYGMMRVDLPRSFRPWRAFPVLIGHSGSTGSFAYYCREKELYLAGTLNQIAAPSRPVRLMIRIAEAR